MRALKVTTEQIQAARRVNLFDWLIAHPIIEYKRDGSQSLKLLSNHSVNIYMSGYRDFATDEHGNAIDFLQRYCGYDFKRAVIELIADTAASSFPAPSSSSSCASTPKDVPAVSKTHLVKRLELPNRNITTKRIYGYLISRGLPADVIKTLVNRACCMRMTTITLYSYRREETFTRSVGRYPKSNSVRADEMKAAIGSTIQIQTRRR